MDGRNGQKKTDNLCWRWPMSLAKYQFFSNPLSFRSTKDIALTAKCTVILLFILVFPELCSFFFFCSFGVCNKAQVQYRVLVSLPFIFLFFNLVRKRVFQFTAINLRGTLKFNFWLFWFLFSLCSQCCAARAHHTI